jgi:hypothetical protein
MGRAAHAKDCGDTNEPFEADATHLDTLSSLVEGYLGRKPSRKEIDVIDLLHRLMDCLPLPKTDWLQGISNGRQHLRCGQCQQSVVTNSHHDLSRWCQAHRARRGLVEPKYVAER